MDYQAFLKFYKKFPNKPNKVYYTQFPNANKNTIRSYKTRARRELEALQKRDVSQDKTDTKATNDTQLSLQSQAKRNPNENGGAKGTPPSLTPTQLKQHSWEDLLKMAIFGNVKLDYQALKLYMEMGWLEKDVNKDPTQRFIFRTPDFVLNTPHQLTMYEAFLRGNCCVIGARQETYKTTTGLVAAANKLHTNDGSNIVQISTGLDLSKELLGKVDYDERVREVWSPILKTSNRETKILENGSRLLCRPCKPASLQGLTGGLWIDEMDKIIKERQTREALAAALPIVITLLKAGTGFIWITCNQASGEGAAQFQYFINVLKKFGNLFPVYYVRLNDNGKGFYLDQINHFDVKVVDDTFWRGMLFALLEALYDESFAKAQLLNIYDDQSGMFRADLIAKAFEAWSEDKFPPYPYNCIMEIDPGHTHATGILILQKCENGDLIEVYAEEIFGTSMSEDDLKAHVIDLAHQFGVRAIYCESNSGGQYWMDHWRAHGLICYASNFGIGNPNTGEVTNEQKALERAYYERVLKWFVEGHDPKVQEQSEIYHEKIYLHNKDLLKEWSLYNPTENKEKGKGDLMDCLVKGAFHCAGGMGFLRELYERTAGEERAPAYT